MNIKTERSEAPADSQWTVGTQITAQDAQTTSSRASRASPRSSQNTYYNQASADLPA